jgi:hypothetical protein
LQGWAQCTAACRLPSLVSRRRTGKQTKTTMVNDSFCVIKNTVDGWRLYSFQDLEYEEMCLSKTATGFHSWLHFCTIVPMTHY